MDGSDRGILNSVQFVQGEVLVIDNDWSEWPLVAVLLRCIVRVTMCTVAIESCSLIYRVSTYHSARRMLSLTDILLKVVSPWNVGKIEDRLVVDPEDKIIKINSINPFYVEIHLGPFAGNSNMVFRIVAVSQVLTGPCIQSTLEALTHCLHPHQECLFPKFMSGNL